MYVGHCKSVIGVVGGAAIPTDFRRKYLIGTNFSSSWEKHDRYVYSGSRLSFIESAECSTTSTRNISFKFQTFNKLNCRAVSKVEDNRTINLFLGSNKWGYFVKIQEIRREGSTFLIIPFDSTSDGPKLFTKALTIFTKRAFNLEVRSKEPQDSQLHSPIGNVVSPIPANTGQTINIQQSGDVTSSEVLVGKPTAEVFPPLPRIILSPYAPAFVPALCSYAALFTQKQGTEAETEPKEDPFSNLNGQNLLLSLNAVEDHPKEKEGPILYTHSDGEDFVFIDTKLKPLQIDFSRCSKHPLQLRKELKGRKTYSPSQIVTRSKAKILEQGRKFNPIGWIEEEDLLDPQESHEDEINGTANINALRAAAEGVKRFVYISAADFCFVIYLLQGYIL
ncbi:unnamed protein product [Cuscuta campestris]|uniref:Uncharacterized protein n=1 Tax=Cuscuta campestris TaxID=132261 RepID=A0A484LPN8_9ASTE|nr:unnamed protein product [Cuscuta campestris]